MPNKPPSEKQGDPATKSLKLALRSSKTEAEETADSMTTLSDLLSDLKDELKAFRDEFNVKTDTSAKKLNEVTNSILSIEGSIANINVEVTSNTRRITEIEQRLSKAEDEIKEKETVLAHALKRIAELETKTTDLEDRGRRKNVRILGLKDGAPGTASLLEFVSNMLPKWLNLNQTSMILESVYWVGPKTSQNRAVLVRFLRDQDKDRVLREAKARSVTHEGNKLAFFQDLSPETLRQRRGFNEAKKLFMEKGIYRGFTYNPCRMRILYQGHIRLFSSSEEAVHFYKDITVAA